MKLSLRVKLTLWYVGSICFLISAFFAYTYINFSHAIYKSDVIPRFDAELLRYAERVRDKIKLVPGPFYTPVAEYTNRFNSWIEDDLFLSATYGQLINLPSENGTPVISIRNAALEGRLSFREAYDLTGLRGGAFQEYARRLGVDLP